MKVLILLLTACLLVTPLFAGNIIVCGSPLPLIEGALPMGTEQIGEAQVYTCVLERHIDEVVEFYENFFEKNKFQLIGGKKGNEYNVSVKRNGSMFTLRIYREDKRTIMQFVW